MALWNILKTAIANVVKTNGNQEITGQVLQNALNSIINAVGENATFAGIAIPSTNPGIPDGPTFYIASKSGSYSNFGSTVINNDLTILSWNGNSWVATSLGISTTDRLNDLVRCLSFAHGMRAVIKQGNLLSGVSFTNGKYLNMNNGREEIMSTYSYSDYIDISGMSLLMLHSVSSSAACFYNSDKQYLSGVGNGLPAGMYNNEIVEVPADAKYIRYNVPIADRNSGAAFIINAQSIANLIIKYPWLICEDTRFEKIPLAGLSMKYERGILTANNTLETHPTFKTYTFNVSSYAGQDVTITARGLAYATGNRPLYIIVHEDDTTSVVLNVVGSTITDYKVTLPDDAKYLRMSSTLNILIANANNTLILPTIYTTTEEKQERIRSIMKLPPSGKFAIIEDSSINLLLNTTFTNGKYLNMNNGREEIMNTYSYSDYIDVSLISILQICMVSNHGGCFYDKDKNFISGFGISDYGGVSGGIQNFIAEVPADAKYVRINVSIAYRNNGTAYAIDYSLSPSKVKYPWLEISAFLLLPAIGTAYGYMTNNGTINTSIPSGGTITKYDVTGVKSVLISLSGNLSSGANPKLCTIWVVDESNSPILMLPVDTTGNVLNDYPLTIPENGVQLWVQSASPEVGISSDVNTVLKNIQKYIADLQNIEIKTDNQWTGKKIVWLGTSIPYGQGTDGVASAPTTYPMQIGKKLGATVVNVARPGMSIETTADFKRKTLGSLSLTIAELQSEGAATTPYQSYENAMLGHDADLYVFDCEPNNSNWDLTDLENFSVHSWAYKDGSSFESHRNSYVGALLFLLNKLWTEKPSAKVVFISEFISGSNLDSRYKGLEASKAVAEKLRIPLIDVADKLYYTPLNKSLYLNSDNVHPKQATHDRIANILATELLSIN